MFTIYIRFDGKTVSAEGKYVPTNLAYEHQSQVKTAYLRLVLPFTSLAKVLHSTGEVEPNTEASQFLADKFTARFKQVQNELDGGAAKTKYLASRTKRWLLGQARAEDIRGRSRMNKAQLVAALCN